MIIDGRKEIWSEWRRKRIDKIEGRSCIEKKTFRRRSRKIETLAIVLGKLRRIRKIGIIKKKNRFGGIKEKKRRGRGIIKN